MKLLTQTNSRLLNLSILLLRCMVGVILFMGGSGKALGWFGGFGMAKTIGFYKMSGFSVLETYLSSYTEFIGGFLFIIGFLTRPAAIAVLINMIVATVVAMPKGFIMGTASYPFLLAVIAFIFLLTGPMAYSLDALFFQRGPVIRELRR